jgi:tetratricopeptide (TPR) repeat protein
VATWLSTAQAQTASCAAWPGEPHPLPSVESPDPFLARWASLRAGELARMVAELQERDPNAARETWEHLRCLDPARARAALPALPPTTSPVSAPEPPREVALSAPPPSPDPPPAPRSIAPPVSAPAPSRSTDWSPIDAELGEAQALVFGARFDQALEAAERIRPKLAPVEDAPGASQRWTRLELLAATAQIALGYYEDAQASFERALAADPAFQLDTVSTSPKVLQVFEAVRGRGASAGP